jgi:hypothetical protein
MAEKQTPSEKLGISNPYASEDPALKDDALENLDPTKVVGNYAEQPDPNSKRPAPLPNIPEGVNKAPKDDADDAGAIGDGKNT